MHNNNGYIGITSAVLASVMLSKKDGKTKKSREHVGPHKQLCALVQRLQKCAEKSIMVLKTNLESLFCCSFFLIF